MIVHDFFFLDSAAQLLHSISEEGCAGPIGSTAVDGGHVTKECPPHQPGLSLADFCVLAIEYHCLSHSHGEKEEADWEK